jgi:hypothetical protein
MSPRGWRATSPGAAVSDALLDPVARGRVVDRLDLAALQVGNDQVQALPPPIHVEQGLGLVEDPVVFDGLGHSLRVSPGLAGFWITTGLISGSMPDIPGVTITSDSVRAMGTVRRLTAAAGDVTLGPAADAYLATLRGAEQASTRRTYSRVLRWVVAEFGAESGPGEIDPERFAEWFTARWAHRAPSTWNVSLD